MAFKLSGEIHGLQEVMQRLNKIATAPRRQLLRRAIQVAAQITTKAAKANVRTAGDGLLKRSIGSSVKVYRKSGIAVAMVGPRTGFKRAKGQKIRTALGEKYAVANADPTKYAHLVEGGRAAVSPKEKRVMAAAGIIYGTRARGVAARPFLRPAFDQTKEINKRAIAQVIFEGLSKGT